jgi:competence protein ComEA
VIAKRIIAFRTTNGPFTAIEDLLKVSGIGDAKFAQFKEKIRV